MCCCELGDENVVIQRKCWMNTIFFKTKIIVGQASRVQGHDLPAFSPITMGLECKASTPPLVFLAGSASQSCSIPAGTCMRCVF